MSGTRCDSCGKRIRPRHHECRLLDAQTQQVLGTYHAACSGAAAGYMTRPAVYTLRIFHPQRCGPDLRRCDGGWGLGPERVAGHGVSAYDDEAVLETMRILENLGYGEEPVAATWV